MQQISVDGKGQESELLKHAAEDEALVGSLQCVVNAPREYVSHLIASRTPKDKAELKRILDHLPMVAKKGQSPQRPRNNLANVGAQSLQQTPRGPLVVDAVPPLALGNAAQLTPQLADTARSGFSARAMPSQRKSSSAVTTPRQAVGMVVPSARQGISFCGPPGLSVNRKELPDYQPASAKDEASSKEPVFSTERELLEHQEAVNQKQQIAKEVDMKMKTKLASIGVDPNGMTAEDILKKLYSRGVSTTYAFTNSDVEKKAAKVMKSRQRAATPQSLKGILTPEAVSEVRWSRNMPMADVHWHLDRWEIDFLADMCRSLKHFTDKSEGCRSEYKSQLCFRQPVNQKAQ